MFIDTIRMKRDIIVSLELLKRWVALVEANGLDDDPWFDEALFQETKAWLESLR